MIPAANSHWQLCLACYRRQSSQILKAQYAQATRYNSTIQKSRSWMALSSTVGEDKALRKRRTQKGAFGGMNRTSFEERSKERRPQTRYDSRQSLPNNTIPEQVKSGRARPMPNRASLVRRAPTKIKDLEAQREDKTFRALKMQKALTPVDYVQRTALKTQMEELNDFGNLGLMPLVQESISSQILPGLQYLSPTPIQRLAVPALRKTYRVRRASTEVEPTPKIQRFLLAAETGSGKTLAYLLPIIDAIKRAEMREAEQAAARTSQNPNALDSPDDGYPMYGRPRAIILLPTAELVSQVGRVVKLLSHKVKFRSAMISTAYSAQVIRNRLFAPTGIDLLVTTPRLLASLSDSDPYVLSKVSHLVVDEADSLLDRSFAPYTTKIIDKATSVLKQLIFCSATIPRRLDVYLRDKYPDMTRLTSPNLHAIPRRVQLGVIDVQRPPYQGNKLLACADIIWTIGKAAGGDRLHQPDESIPKSYILVFVNEREKTEEVTEYLVSKGIDAVALNRDNTARKQSSILSEFLTARPIGLNSPSDSVPKQLQDGEEDVSQAIRQIGSTSEINALTTQFARPQSPAASSQSAASLANVRVLVATDLGSRGIDTLAVRHVILFDVPHTTIDFIHRLGRTGRMGRRGRGIVLVGKKDRRDVVKEIKDAMFKGQALI